VQTSTEIERLTIMRSNLEIEINELRNRPATVVTERVEVRDTAMEEKHRILLERYVLLAAELDSLRTYNEEEIKVVEKRTVKNTTVN
jgi:hypothetical protein